MRWPAVRGGRWSWLTARKVQELVRSRISGGARRRGPRGRPAWLADPSAPVISPVAAVVGKPTRRSGGHATPTREPPGYRAYGTRQKGCWAHSQPPTPPQLVQMAPICCTVPARPSQYRPSQTVPMPHMLVEGRLAANATTHRVVRLPRPLRDVHGRVACLHASPARGPPGSRVLPRSGPRRPVAALASAPPTGPTLRAARLRCVR
jgi:hypothetical protein